MTHRRKGPFQNKVLDINIRTHKGLEKDAYFTGKYKTGRHFQDDPFFRPPTYRINLQTNDLLCKVHVVRHTEALILQTDDLLCKVHVVQHTEIWFRKEWHPVFSFNYCRSHATLSYHDNGLLTIDVQHECSKEDLEPMRESYSVEVRALYITPWRLKWLHFTLHLDVWSGCTLHYTLTSEVHSLYITLWFLKYAHFILHLHVRSGRTLHYILTSKAHSLYITSWCLKYAHFILHLDV